MSSAYFDPLEGIETRPIETQVAMLIGEARSQRNSLNGLRGDIAALRSDLGGLRRALIGFALTIAASAIIFAATIFALFR